MKIIYDSDRLPFWCRRLSLTNEEKNLIDLLEHDDYFEKRVLEIRKAFEMPKNGFPLDESFARQELQWEEIKKLLKKNGGLGGLDEKIEKLRNDYFLTYHWQPSLLSLIVNNILVLPTTTTSVGFYPGIYCACNPGQHHWHESKEYALIGIEADITKKEFTSWINKNWNDMIKPHLKKLPRHPKPGQEIMEIYKRIVQLRDKENKKYTEIADILLEEFKVTYSDNQLSGMYKRFKTYLRQRNPK